MTRTFSVWVEVTTPFPRRWNFGRGVIGVMGELKQRLRHLNFADAAHLSRACRAMFGITLSKLAENQIEVH